MRRTAGQVFQVLRNLRRGFRRALYRTGVWFNYQHVAALMLIIIAFSLANTPSASINAALNSLGVVGGSGSVAVIFGICGGRLIGRRIGVLAFFFATLPLLILGLILLWYALFVMPSVGLVGAAYGIGIWAILQAVGSTPEDDTHDSAAGSG